jgi:hypothetical protein
MLYSFLVKVVFFYPFFRDLKRFISLAELKTLHLEHKKSGGGVLANLSLFTRSRFFFFFFFYIIITTQNKSLAIDVKCKYTYYNLRESSLVETPFTFTFTFTLICIQTFSAFLRYCLTLLKIYRQITTLCSTTDRRGIPVYSQPGK